MKRVDRNGIPVRKYPDSYGEAKFLGITNDGLAAFHEDQHVFFAVLNETEDSLHPPSEYGIAHELDLEGFGWTISEYLKFTAEEKGPWRALSAYSKDKLESNECIQDLLMCG